MLFTLYNEISESKLQLLTAPSPYIGKTFDVCSSLLLKQDTLLLGIQRDEQYHINPVHSSIIIEGDVFIVIKH